MVVNKEKLYFYGAVMGACMFFVMAVAVGFMSGKNEAQSKRITLSAKAIAEALGYFYQDQDRFPTASEFANGIVLREYFNAFPPRSYVSAACSETFQYQRPSPDSFALYYCLPQGTDGQEKLWNRITVP